MQTVLARQTAARCSSALAPAPGRLASAPRVVAAPRRLGCFPCRQAAAPLAARRRRAGVVASAEALALLLPVLHPGSAAAAALELPTCSEYWVCVGLGTAGVATTLLLTSRFLLSYFPSLEKRARARPRTALLRLLTVADPVLDPISRGLFKQTEPGELNYGAMALLAVSSGLLALLVGDGGLMVEKVPDLDLLMVFRYLNYYQHMTLLPMWVFVVFRFFLLI